MSTPPVPSSTPTAGRTALGGLRSSVAEPIDFWLQQVNPLWSVRETRARVVSVQRETERVVTVTLRPNGRWRGFTAGQHVLVTLEVDGRRLTRPWTISSAATRERTLTLTIARLPEGRVTGWVHDRLKPGVVVTLSEARGSFVLPEDPTRPLLMIAGGVGVTPFLSMLRTLAARGEGRDVVLLHYVRTTTEAFASDELGAIERALPGVRVVVVPEDGEGPLSGRFAERHLQAIVPDYERRALLLCGPTPMMDVVREVWDRAGLSDSVHTEYFEPPARVVDDGTRVRLHFVGAGLERSGDTATPLLDQAEAAGLTPRHGCRSGICHECTCRKVSGVVVNMRTGAVSSEPGEQIQLCINRPVGDVVLDL